MNRVDLLIVGAGPAGMSAAVAACGRGLEVLVVDDQPAPGGQIWRGIEMTARHDDILGSAYAEGRLVAEAFRASGAIHQEGTQLWRIEPGFRAFISRDGQASVVQAGAVLLATGAQERPTPFAGWTLPGVLTVGAAQIMLKTAGQIPSGPVWIAGSGPLPLLYAVQLLRAGGHIAGYLDTTPPGRWLKALRHLPRALRASADLLKGLGWKATLRKSGVPYVRAVTNVEAIGGERIEALRYRTGSGAVTTVDAGLLLVHEGVVPGIHPVLSLGCDIVWNPAQDSFAPVVDEWGETSRENLFVAGDGAGIGGARAACLRGELAAVRIAARLGRLDGDAAQRIAYPLRRKLDHELSARPFLDALFQPRTAIFEPADDVVICRCEEVTAGEIRALASVGQPGPNQVKAASRAGMGPCQGRQCGYTVTRLLCSTQNRQPADVGFFNIRPPLKPITLGELASLAGKIAP